VGLAGSALGLVAAVPIALLAARAGITTTGRARIGWVHFPWGAMLMVSLVGLGSALLGILQPVRRAIRTDVGATLRSTARLDPASRGLGSSMAWLTIPFLALLYLLVRPFFRELLPSLLFFVLESGLVCLGFLSFMVLVPDAIGRIGSKVIALLPNKPAAARLLTLRRVERSGHDLAWSVSGVMMVFALLLALHLSTHALKSEVTEWASRAVRSYAWVYARSGDDRVPAEILPTAPEGTLRIPFSGRTPWPNSVYAVAGSDLLELAEARGDEAPELIEIARRFGPGRAILSTLMARRYGLTVGDRLELDGAGGPARFEVLAVTDQIGYVPMIGPYRNSKTYALIDAAEFDRIAPYAAPLGESWVYAPRRGRAVPDYHSLLAPLRHHHWLRTEIGALLEHDRVLETNSDFAIFDLILLLTTLLAAVGVSNQLLLSAHARRREIALLRVLGMTAGQVRSMFLLEGGFVGILGGVLAILLGIPLGFGAIQALAAVSAFEVRFELPPEYALSTLLGAVLVSLVASLYPAGRAAAASSAEAVHYE
jgi:putative ABC transport system permease protein